MNYEEDRFPYSPKARSAAKKPIEWGECPMELLAGSLALWKALDRGQVKQLVVRWPVLFKRMPPSQQQFALIAIGDLPEPTDMPAEEDSTSAKKSSLIKRAREVAQSAEANEDRANALKALEIEAKLEAMLNAKPEQDRVVNIFVVTGVPRG